MKNLILILLISIANIVFSQDTLTYYVTGSGEKVSQEESKYVRKVFKTPKGLYKVWDYYEDGQLQMTGTYLNDSLKKGAGPFIKYFKSGKTESTWTYVKGKSDGQSKKYFESGELKSSIDMVQGKKHGKLLTFWENGTQKREDNYHNGVFILGKCFNEKEEEIEHFPFMIFPELPGGKKGIQQFLSKNVVFPPEAKANGITGRVILNFTVEKDGSTKEIKIKRASHPLFNKEALRVANLLPNWIPGKRDGELISVNYNLPISFQLRGMNEVVVGPNARAVKSYNKATKLFVKQEFQKAITQYSDAIMWYPEYTKAYLNRAISYARIRDIENACKDWKKAAELGDKGVQSNIDKYCK